MFTATESAEAQRALHPLRAPALTRKEIGQYSLARELFRILTGAGEPGLERAYTTTAYRGPDAAPFAYRSVCVPPEIIARDMGLAPGSKGGFLTQTDVDSPLSALDAVRPLSVALRAGARVIRLENAVTAPRQVGGITATWLGPGITDTVEDIALGSVSFVVRQIIGVFTFSRQLLVQAPQLVEKVLLQEGLGALATALDRAALRGSGGVEPLGILNAQGVGTQSGTSLGVVGLLNMQETCATANGLSRPDAFRYITTPAVAELLAQRAVLGTGTVPVWQGALADGALLGCPAYATTNMSAATMIGGDFTRLVIASFQDGIQIDVANASFDAGTVALRVSLMADCAVTSPEGFVISTSIT